MAQPQLEQQLWKIANTLRGSMDANDFKDYILGFIFYKYLSEKVHSYADEILSPDGIVYNDIDENSETGKQYLEAIKHETLDKLGYFLKPSELFDVMSKRGNSDGTSKFILDDLEKVFNNIQKYGNTTAATLPILLSELWEQNRIKEGQLFALAAFGSGFTWASALIRW